MNYFNKLPTISYQGQLVKNLLARAKLSDETRSNNLVFQKYTTEDSDRVDLLANDYYDSPGYSWLVWFSNDTIDPYYGLALSERDFQDYIKTKYGSIEAASRKIVQFRLNWDLLDNEVTPAEFQLLGTRKKYYTPILNEYLQTSRYVVKQDETAVTTNVVVKVTFSEVSGAFVPGEEIRKSSSVYGYVGTEATDDSLLVYNVVQLGSVFLPGDVLTGVESNATLTVESVDIITKAIPDDELSFWQPVSAYDLEVEENERKKNIKLLDARYKDTAEAELKRLMRDR